MVYTLSPPELYAEEKKHRILDGIVAGGETFLSDAVLLGFTAGVFNYDWAKPTAEGIHRNFTEPWIWEDTDGFMVNQFGHPYQGTTYFNAGRSNGFSFYESFLFSALGSAVWETLCERQSASINDFITTAAGSGALGEILYRLYMEAYASNVPAPLAFLISPITGLTRLVTRHLPEYKGGNLYAASLYIGGGYTQVSGVKISEAEEFYAFQGIPLNLGANIVYGNPFEQESRVPYQHFEAAFALDINPISSYLNMRFISDGYLFSFSPVYTEQDRLSAGLSLHFDVVTLGKMTAVDSCIDMANNALDWTVKYQHLFHNGIKLHLKTHIGGIFLGVSEYYSLDTAGTGITMEDDYSLKNYGGGINAKLYVNLEYEKLGSLLFNVFWYHIWSYPGTVAFSSGTVLWLFADITYTYRIVKHLSVGIADSFALEYGRFSDPPDTRKWSNTIKIFIAWNL